MFVRLTKISEGNYRKVLALGNSYLIQDNDKIVAYGKMNWQGQKNACKLYVLDDENKEYNIAYIKRFICHSNKWQGGDKIRRKYIINHVNSLNENDIRILWL